MQDMQKGPFAGNLGGLVRVQVGDEWEPAVLGIQLGKESKISLTEVQNGCSHDSTDVFYECPLRECTITVPTNGWMEGSSDESSHDFVICPSDTKHQRRRVRPAEGEDLDSWVSLMVVGGARLRLVKSIDSMPITPRTPAIARRSTWPAGAEPQLQQQQHVKEEHQWRLDAFLHSVLGGLMGAVGGKGNINSRAEVDEEVEALAPSTPSTSPRRPSLDRRTKSVDIRMMMEKKSSYPLEDPLQHGREDSSDNCALQDMLDTVADEEAMQASPGPIHVARGGEGGALSLGARLSRSLDLSLAGDISLHDNSIFSLEDDCNDMDASPRAMIPSHLKRESHEFHQMKLPLPIPASPFARSETF